MRVTWLICLIVTSAVTLAVCVLIVFSSAQLLLFQRENWFTARWGDKYLFYWYAGCCAIYCLTIPLSLFHAMTISNEELDRLSGPSYWTRLIGNVLDVMSYSGAAFALMIRAWNHNFNANVAVQLGMVEWRSIIDQSIKNEKKSWLLQYKSSLGNWRWLLRLVLVLWIIGGLMAWLLSHFAGLSPIILHTAVIIIAIPFGMLNYKYYPPFQDMIELRTEWRLVIYAMLIISPIWILIVCLPLIFGWSWRNNRSAMIVLFTVRQVYILITVYIVIYITTMLVVSLFRQPSKSVPLCNGWILPIYFKRDEEVRNPSLRNMTVMASNSSQSRLSNLHPKDVSLSAVLADNRIFSAFMTHLFAEFSYENALCMIECIKFREHMIAMTGRTNDPECDDEEDSISELVFCEDIRRTKSSLVNGIKDLQGASDVGNLLYQRYMSEYSPYCVNLGFRIRNSTLMALQSDPIGYDVFDDVIKACFLLLKESLSRFVHSERWRRHSATAED